MNDNIPDGIVQWRDLVWSKPRLLITECKVYPSEELILKTMDLEMLRCKTPKRAMNPGAL